MFPGVKYFLRNRAPLFEAVMTDLASALLLFGVDRASERRLYTKVSRHNIL